MACMTEWRMPISTRTRGMDVPAYYCVQYTTMVLSGRSASGLDDEEISSSCFGPPARRFRPFFD